MKKLLTAGAAAGILLAAGACGRKTPPPAPPATELVIFCGGSFQKPVEELRAKFTTATGIPTIMSVGGSEDFLPVVTTAGKGDVLITHDPFLDYVRDAGRLGAHARVGTVAPVLAVRKGNPLKLEKIEDLAREGLRVALPDPKYSTCGEMVDHLLVKKGIRDGVMKNVGTRLTKGHGPIGTFLQTDAVDAAIMWNGVACTFRESVDIVKTDEVYDREIGVHVIGLNYTKSPGLLAKFMAFAGKEGENIFKEHGYAK
ncbi:MAG: substrate-binding domain-containing protein [Planctomycetota bacterium]